jgi:hypothetical protein
MKDTSEKQPSEMSSTDRIPVRLEDGRVVGSVEEESVGWDWYCGLMPHRQDDPTCRKCGRSRAFYRPGDGSALPRGFCESCQASVDRRLAHRLHDAMNDVRAITAKMAVNMPSRCDAKEALDEVTDAWLEGLKESVADGRRGKRIHGRTSCAMCGCSTVRLDPMSEPPHPYCESCESNKHRKNRRDRWRGFQRRCEAAEASQHSLEQLHAMPDALVGGAA